jgi:hypothetical protein
MPFPANAAGSTRSADGASPRRVSDVVNRVVVAGTVIVTLLVGACGSTPTPTAPASQPAPSSGSVAIDEVPTTWHQATVLPPDEPAFRAATAQRGVTIGDKSVWARDERAAWIPAESVDESSRIGVVSWNGRLVSWSDGGLIRTSQDGLTWIDAIVGPDESNPTMIVPYADQLLLLGQPTRSLIGAWRSADGSRWTAIDGAPLGMQAAVDAGGRGIVAVGSQGADPAIWTSADSAAWASTPAPERRGPETSALYGVSAGPLGVVAIGDAEARAAAWSSNDLASWTQSPSFGDDVFLEAISNVRGTFVIAGRRGDRPVVWSSPDGQSWTSTDLPTSGPGAAEAAVVRIVDESLVAFGYTTEDAGNGGSSRTGYLIWTLDLMR